MQPVFSIGRQVKIGDAVNTRFNFTKMINITFVAFDGYRCSRIGHIGFAIEFYGVTQRNKGTVAAAVNYAFNYQIVRIDRYDCRLIGFFAANKC